MRLLLDTHIALWALAASPRLPLRAGELIIEASNQIHVSVASLWEIAIKRAKARRDVPAISSAAAAQSFRVAGYQILEITAEHAAIVETLPLLHQDPFDRLLVAQALCEPLILLTHDALLARYGNWVMHV